MFDNMFEKALKILKKGQQWYIHLMACPFKDGDKISVDLIFKAPNVANLGFRKI